MQQSTAASRASNQNTERGEPSKHRAERVIKHRAGSVIARPQGAAYREELELRTVGDQLLDRIEYIDQMASIGADRRYADARTAVQLKMINFGHTEARIACARRRSEGGPRSAFSFSERTSPSNRSNSSAPTHMAMRTG